MIDPDSIPANPPIDPSRPRVLQNRPTRTRLWLRAAVGTGIVAGLWVIVLFGTRTPSQASNNDPLERKTDSGITYKNDKVSHGPWSIHIAKIDRSRKDLSFVTPLARGTVLGVSTVAEMARAVPPALGRAVAGVNGDFYERDNRFYAGDPRGLQIVNGELVSGPSTVSVWFDGERNPHLGEVKGDFKLTWPEGKTMRFGLNEQRRPNAAVLYTSTYGPTTRAKGGLEFVLEREGEGPWLPLRPGQAYRARIKDVLDAGDSPLRTNLLVLSLGPQLAGSFSAIPTGAVVQISTAITPEMTGVLNAISGGPALIVDGKPFALRRPPPGLTEAYSERSKYERHPRSAVGWNDKSIFLIEVDGRQPELSVGMTLAELAAYMVKLGCTDGMNFDGGNSATMWLLGQVVNSPCQGEKPVANSLLVVRKELSGGP